LASSPGDKHSAGSGKGIQGGRDFEGSIESPNYYVYLTGRNPCIAVEAANWFIRLMAQCKVALSAIVLRILADRITEYCRKAE